MKKALLPVADALAQILEDAHALKGESVALDQALGRTLASDLAALRTQPPFDVSSMDGYALRTADQARADGMRVVGTSAAGHRYDDALQPGDAVRIFTGAPMPAGADTVLIQENARRDGDRLWATTPAEHGRNIREAGIDFLDGETLLRAGTRLGPSALSLAASMNHASLPVVRRPRVAFLATGDELGRPGASLGPDQIVASNTYAVMAYAEQAGAEKIDLGIAADTMEALASAIEAARTAKADVLVTLGGASVGDHDLVQSALTREGMELGFWRIAMRPGKPLMHGRLGDTHVLGLPGNPVSAIVCGVLFLLPLVRALSGDPTAGGDRTEAARLAVDLKANDERQDYLRGKVSGGGDRPVVTPVGLQDSSLLRRLAEADVLIIRAPHAPAAKAGDTCRILRL